MAKNPERATQFNCLTRVFVVDARHDGRLATVLCRQVCGPVRDEDIKMVIGVLQLPVTAIIVAISAED